MEEGTVTIDEKEYIFDDLPEAVQHCLVQIQEVRNLAATAYIEAQRYEMAQRGYTAELGEQLEKFNSPLVG